ncbi:SDR family NAD(P)-dependent oxidoreductase [Kushneria konosiri]|uniref:Short-chain dehydrogenase n=1 Tax=Kushneria konosiri TaxID=698828 RepID=A0A2Z2H555_9GAMM|nr:SDR family NAD(P)-dependent oxidoreductase [Kushneria konosiri]ARS52483.1 short-chain dehydrogenase [Kushneria konosiri]
MTFERQVILLTGAGRGLGLAYARYLAALGATIVLQDTGADRYGFGEDDAVAEMAAERLRFMGGRVHAMGGSLDSRKQCHRLVETVLERHGRLDGLIHNAGWVAHQEVEEIDEVAFDSMMTIAARAPLWLAQAAWPAMKAAGGGRIVVTTSCRAIYPQYVQKGLASYAAAKMAALGIVNVLAREGASHKIVVNALSPVAKTRMWGVDGEPEELRPDEVAPGAAFLVSEACVDGGWVLRAANGQFHATRATEAEGVDYPQDLQGVCATSAAEIAARWSRIALPAVEPRSR